MKQSYLWYSIGRLKGPYRDEMDARLLATADADVDMGVIFLDPRIQL